MDIVSLGVAIMDMFPTETGRKLAEVSAFLPVPGGGPMNVAVAAARLGAKSAFIGKVGDDAFGRHLIDVLNREGVNTSCMHMDNQARTTMNFHAKPDEHTIEYLFYRNPGADTLLRSDELDDKLLKDASVFHFDSCNLTHEPCRSATLEALKIAHEGGALISFDVNYRSVIWENTETAYDCIMSILPQVDLLKANEDELFLLIKKKELSAVENLLERGPQICIVTLGEEGSFLQTTQGHEKIPGFKVNVVDVIGCGDAFMAGFLTKIIESGYWKRNFSLDQLRRTLQYANIVGALTAQKVGVISALPFAADVEKFIAQHNLH